MKTILICTKHLMIVLALVWLTACGGSSSGGLSSEQQAASNHIASYVNNGSDQAPKMTDYEALGIQGVTEENIDSVNALIRDLNIVEVDSIADALEVWEKIKQYAQTNGASEAPKESDYEKLGIVGVNATNIVAINALIAGSESFDVDAQGEIQGIVNGMPVPTPTPTPTPSPSPSPSPTPTPTPTPAPTPAPSPSPSPSPTPSPSPAPTPTPMSSPTPSPVPSPSPTPTPSPSPIPTYTLTYAAGAHGALSGSTNQTLEQGADGTAVTATADTGYHFTSWNDGSVQNPRTDSNIQINLSVTANFAADPTVSTAQSVYSANETVTVDVAGSLSGDKDWVGIYPADANNSWSNVIAWNWTTGGTVALSRKKKPMPAGAYEVRLFFHNEFGSGAIVRAQSGFAVNDYGEVGTHPVSHHDEVDGNMTTAYYPTDIPDGTKVPVIFFASGYDSTDSNDYKTLLTFIASHGYYVIYSKQNKHGWNDVFANLDKMLDNDNGILPNLDTTRIGVMGHSLGGGYTFNMLKHFSDMGYGENGRFVMVLEGYYAYNLTKDEIQNLPSNTNVVMQQYGAGGNNGVNDTDPRITLTEFYLLDSIPNNQKDWQIVENADHHYPYGSGAYSTMQGILKPLDALMDYTFNGTEAAHDTALEVGSDDPYAQGNGIQVVKPIDEYGYKCDHDINVAIDYCDMAQWYSDKQLILHQKGHWLPSMAGNFASRAAYINTLPFSGFTMVGNSYTDRVMEPNAPVLTYDYIWNEVKDVKDLYPTKSNFLTVHMHYPGDFWDDAIWDHVISNFQTLAKVAKNLGYRGIVYDDEPYDVESRKMINYKHGDGWYDDDAYKNPDHTFVEHSAKITALFQQIMEAMVSEYPAIDVLYYHSPVEGHIEANDGINGHPVVVDVGLEREHEWAGAMFAGLKKGLSHQATLHDMGEDYKLRTQAHFDDAYAWRKYTIAEEATNNAVDATEHWIVPQEERATWAAEVHVNFMVSNEPLASDTYPEFDTTNTVGLNDMKTTLERALTKSDKYVTFYSASSSDNKGGLIPLDWLNDPATHADNGSDYSVDPEWRAMVEEVYTNKVLK